MDIAAEIAASIDDIVKANVFENGNPVIDWQKNDDIKGKMRIEIDDLLFEFKTKYEMEISFGQIDQLIAECIKVSETKYKS
jgi:type I restriction enzyme R subunit